MQRTFSRLAIVNRGEQAMRLIHAVHELNRDRKIPIAVMALFPEGAREAMFVRRADEAVCLGPSLVDDGLGGWRNGYLNYGALESALRRAEGGAGGGGG